MNLFSFFEIIKRNLCFNLKPEFPTSTSLKMLLNKHYMNTGSVVYVETDRSQNEKLEVNFCLAGC